MSFYPVRLHMHTAAGRKRHQDREVTTFVVMTPPLDPVRLRQTYRYYRGYMPASDARRLATWQHACDWQPARPEVTP